MWTFSSNFLFVFVSLFGTQYTRSRQFTKRPTLTSSNSLEYKFFVTKGKEDKEEWTERKKSEGNLTFYEYQWWVE